MASELQRFCQLLRGFALPLQTDAKALKSEVEADASACARQVSGDAAFPGPQQRSVSEMEAKLDQLAMQQEALPLLELLLQPLEQVHAGNEAMLKQVEKQLSQFGYRDAAEDAAAEERENIQPADGSGGTPARAEALKSPVGKATTPFRSPRPRRPLSVRTPQQQQTPASPQYASQDNEELRTPTLADFGISSAMAMSSADDHGPRHADHDAAPVGGMTTLQPSPPATPKALVFSPQRAAQARASRLPRPPASPRLSSCSPGASPRSLQPGSSLVAQIALPSDDEVGRVPSYLTAQVDAETLRHAVVAFNAYLTSTQRGFLSQDEAASAAALGTKCKAVLLILLNLNYLVSERIDGATVYRPR